MRTICNKRDSGAPQPLNAEQSGTGPRTTAMRSAKDEAYRP